MEVDKSVELFLFSTNGIVEIKKKDWSEAAHKKKHLQQTRHGGITE